MPISAVKQVLHHHGLTKKKKQLPQNLQLQAPLKSAAAYINQRNAFWIKVLWPDETKIKHQLSSMVMGVSCSGVILLPVVLIHCTGWMR